MNFQKLTHGDKIESGMVSFRKDIPLVVLFVKKRYVRVSEEGVEFCENTYSRILKEWIDDGAEWVKKQNEI